MSDAESAGLSDSAYMGYASLTTMLDGKFPLKEKCQHNLTERVAAAAAPNQGAVVHLDKVPLAASPLLPATHEK